VVDLPARRGLLDLLDKMAAQALPAQLDLEASPETSDSPDPKDLVVRLASLVRRDPLAPLD